MFKFDAELERLFRQQFRVEDGRLVFRSNSKAAPVPVTEQEQEQEDAVAVFLKRNCIAMAILVGGTVLVVFALMLVGVNMAEAASTKWLLVAALAALVVLSLRWSWYGPLARFTRRTPVGRERSLAEVRAEMLAGWSWAKLWGFIAAGLLIVVPHVLAWPPDGLDAWVWIVLGAIMLIGSVANCFLKWRAAASPLVLARLRS
jgi:hypothetical protein